MLEVILKDTAILKSILGAASFLIILLWMRNSILSMEDDAIYNIGGIIMAGLFGFIVVAAVIFMIP